MGYKLFSDVTADVSDELMAGMPPVELVPMQVELGGENYTYGPGGDLTVAHFYAEQRAGKFASTSQINPIVYRECFEKTLKEGEDILYLCFSSGLSGTLQSANLCAQELREEYPERKLIVVDTLCAAVGEAMLVREAARKQQAAAEAEYFEELKVLFQSYADEAGYTMQIIRVQGVRATIFVYYVSDYPFADGNRFPAFLKSVRFFFPHHRIVLRHVMDQDGHFLTRKEYAQIKR